MLSKTKPTAQLGMFHGLAEQLNQKHPLFLLAHKIDWSLFEDNFKKHYNEKMGKPAKPIRLMVALLILKHVRNLSDENLVEHWSENLYFQYFSGEQFFQPAIPCVPTELVAFRQRIGEEGVELILKESIRVNDAAEDSSGDVVVSVDTTVQEKNITYPTDDKLYKKIIKKCWMIADKEGIDLRQSYVQVVKKLGHQQRFKNSIQGAKAARKAGKKIKIIAGRLLRVLPESCHWKGWALTCPPSNYTSGYCRKNGETLIKSTVCMNPMLNATRRVKNIKSLSSAARLLY